MARARAAVRRAALTAVSSPYPSLTLTLKPNPNPTLSLTLEP